MSYLYYPTYNNPKELNIEDFIPPSRVVETYSGGLKVQENMIIPKYPIYVNYKYYNWDWTINEGPNNSPNKWFWRDENDVPVVGSAGMDETSAQALADSEGFGTVVEVYAPLRIWVGSTITDGIASTPGTGTEQRDNSIYSSSRSHDLTFYMKKGKAVLGGVTSERSPHHIEYYIKDGKIITNFDFDSDVEARDSLVITYQTITKNVKLKIVMRTNEPNKSDLTPTVDNYIIRVKGQTYTKERTT